MTPSTRKAKKWRPEVGEKIWFVCLNADEIVLENDTWDDACENFYKTPVFNCFRTKSAALAKLRLIKKILSN